MSSNWLPWQLLHFSPLTFTDDRSWWHLITWPRSGFLFYLNTALWIGFDGICLCGQTDVRISQARYPVVGVCKIKQEYITTLLIKIFSKYKSWLGLNRFDVSSWAVDSGLIPSRVKPMILKMVFTFPCMMLSFERKGWKTSRQIYMLCR